VKIHIVQKGDTLWKIAKKYGVNFEELKKMNSQLSNPDMIMPGMKIKVPTAGANIKKEAPIGAPKATINKGVKKEMPKKEQPIIKEKPVAPIAEIPVQGQKYVVNNGPHPLSTSKNSLVSRSMRSNIFAKNCKGIFQQPVKRLGLFFFGVVFGQVASNGSKKKPATFKIAGFPLFTWGG